MNREKLFLEMQKKNAGQFFPHFLRLFTLFQLTNSIRAAAAAAAAATAAAAAGHSLSVSVGCSAFGTGDLSHLCHN